MHVRILIAASSLFALSGCAEALVGGVAAGASLLGKGVSYVDDSTDKALEAGNERNERRKTIRHDIYRAQDGKCDEIRDDIARSDEDLETKLAKHDKLIECLTTNYPQFGKTLLSEDEEGN